MFEIVRLVCSLIDSCDRFVLLRVLVGLHLQGLVSLGTSNVALVLHVSHIILLIALLHAGELLLVTITERPNGGACFFSSGRLFLGFKFLAHSYLFSIGVEEDLLLSSLDHCLLFSHLPSDHVIVVDKVTISVCVISVGVFSCSSLLVNHILSLFAKHSLLLPVHLRLVSILCGLLVNSSEHELSLTLSVLLV